jgi:hypothetical protein
MFKCVHAIVFLIFLSLPCSAGAQTFAFSGSTEFGALTLSFADGQSTVVTATDQGWWSPTEQNFVGNRNTIIGSCFGVRWNDFFVFDLTGLSGTVVAASLDLQTSAVSGLPSMTLWDVSTALTALEALNAAPNAGIFADLGSGTQYSAAYAISASDASIAIPLNSAGVAAVNDGLGSTLAIGGSADPIPEPAPAGVMAVVLAALAALRYRPRQATKRSAFS